MRPCIDWSLAAVAVSALAVAWPASVQAQDACATAAAQVADCAVQYCPLLEESAAACQTELSNVQATLEACDADFVARVRRSSCASLALGAEAGSPLGGGAQLGGGTICERAAEHILRCAEESCQANPDGPMCVALPEMRSSMEAMLSMDCAGPEAEGAEQVLQMSCSDFGF